MSLILFGHHARVGKDSAADYLVKRYGFVKLAFANPLKEAVRITHGYSDEQLHGNLKEVVDPFWKETPRQTLQRFGTDGLRMNYRSDIWIMSTKRKVIELIKDGKDVVLADGRFINEAEAMKDMGGFIVRIDASFEGKEEIKTSKHISEIEMENYKGWDYVIKNNSTLDEFYKKVDNMYLGLIKK